MRLSLVFELLLIFVLLAFAASRVIDSKGSRDVHRAALRKHEKVGQKNRQDSPNRYCSCSAKLCNCCREFNIPVVSLKGPGCASLQYLKGDRLAISMSFGERVLTNTTIDGRKPKPVCMPLPGGVSKFCGRVYNIGRKGDDFNACLGLELRALKQVEASLRVSCFKFGPQGLKVEPPQPLPAVEEAANEEDEDDDDDDDDDYDFDDIDDDDDDDEEEDDADNDVDSVDYGTFAFDDDFIGTLFVSESDNKKPIRKVTSTTTTAAPTKKRRTRKPTRPLKTTTKPHRRRKPTKTTTTTELIKKVTTTTPLPIVTQATTQKFLAVTEAATSTTKTVTKIEIPNEIKEPTPHESIAAVTAMLQQIPGEQQIPEQQTPDQQISEEQISEQPPADSKPIPEPTLITSAPIRNEIVSEESILPTENTPSIEFITERYEDNPDVTYTENDIENEATTSTYEEEMSTIVHDDEDEDNEENEDKEDRESEESFILKKGEKEDDDDDDDDDFLDDDDDEDDEDDKNSEEDDDDPISSVVSDVLGDDDDDKKPPTKATNTKEKDLTKKSIKKKKNEDSGDIISDLMDAVIGSDKKKNKNKKVPVQSDDDDDDDDDDFLNDDDDDDDDDESRKLHKRSRQSRDMWLARLHW